jgi:hypothetical protein
METEFEIDYKSISLNKIVLDDISENQYWGKFKGDWKSYLSEVFDGSDMISVDPPRTNPVTPHPFIDWI